MLLFWSTTSCFLVSSSEQQGTYRWLCGSCDMKNILKHITFLLFIIFIFSCSCHVVLFFVFGLFTCLIRYDLVVVAVGLLSLSCCNASYFSFHVVKAAGSKRLIKLDYNSHISLILHIFVQKLCMYWSVYTLFLYIYVTVYSL